MARVYDHDTGERLALVDLRGKGSKARNRRNRKGRFGLMYKAECAEDILTSQSLSHFEARLAMFLFVRTNWDNQVEMSQTRIADLMHVPPSQISRTIKKLLKYGIVRMESRGVIEINPRFFFMGEDDERDIAIKDRAHLFLGDEAHHFPS